MNDDVRALFRQQAGFDPIELFGARKDAARAELPRFPRRSRDAACRRNGSANWRAMRREKPQLDLVLTHVDDRFDTGMRDAIGADAARVLPLLDRTASRS
jgi:pyruvate-formate lyase-activating enzyme